MADNNRVVRLVQSSLILDPHLLAGDTKARKKFAYLTFAPNTVKAGMELRRWAFEYRDEATEKHRGSAVFAA